MISRMLLAHKQLHGHSRIKDKFDLFEQQALNHEDQEN
jgi:hypothetical protein